MDWLKYFTAFGGTVLCSLILTAIFNRVVNGSKKKRAEKEQKCKEEREKEIQTIVDTINARLDEKLEVIINDNETMKSGLQALLRSQLYELHHEWVRKGYAPDYVKENFENCYNKYHILGANGVMNRYREELLSLPNEEPTKTSK